MTKLNDTQLLILSAASQRQNHAIYPLPKTVTADECGKYLKKLLKTGMVEETEAKASGHVWREEEDGQKFTLKLTNEGLQALGLEPEEPRPVNEESAAKPKPQKQLPEKDKPKTDNTKQKTIIELLQRPKGASITDIAEATGWQRHSVHGVMSGVLRKKMGLNISSESTADGRIYKILASA